MNVFDNSADSSQERGLLAVEGSTEHRFSKIGDNGIRLLHDQLL
jgi:hypothetical protein